jgi:hypothetical protein
MKQIAFNFTMFLISLAAVIKTSAQSPYAAFYLQREHFEGNLQMLRNEFGSKKIIPPEIELECLTALSFYPELKNTDIEFRFGNLNFTMLSQPKFKSILYDRARRQYLITIQKQGLTKKSIDWRQLSFNAMVGWIGHELGHVLHYSHKSSGGILFVGMKYGVPGYRRKIERFTDQLAIQHHLGYALYEGVTYTLDSSHASEHYKQSQEKFYLNPDEIIARIHSAEGWTSVFRKTKMEHHVSN